MIALIALFVVAFGMLFLAQRMEINDLEERLTKLEYPFLGERHDDGFWGK